MSAYANPFRHQLPAYSPVTARALAAGLQAGLVAAAGVGTDPRELLRRHLEEAYAARRVLLLGSGTQALTLALEVARFGGEDGEAPVALPAYSCFDVATAAVGAGVPVRFYDLDPETLGPDPESLERVLSQGARTVVLAPLFGVPLDRELLDPLLQRWAPLVVEDAAQAHGARWQGEPLGAGGDLVVLSFGRGKGWTGGGGGALLARSASAVEALSRAGRPDAGDLVPAGVGRGVGALLRATALWAMARPDVYRVPCAMPWLGLGETHYRAPEPPASMPAIAAAVLWAARHAAADEAMVRRRHGRELAALLEERGAVGFVRVPPRGTAGYLRFPLRVPGGLAGLADPERGRFLGAEDAYPRILPELPPRAGKVLGTKPAASEGEATEWPGAEALVRELVTFPTHSRTRSWERRELVSLVPVTGGVSAAS